MRIKIIASLGRNKFNCLDDIMLVVLKCLINFSLIFVKSVYRIPRFGNLGKFTGNSA